eukprot:6213711-Pleurochrysis_carterae.AAC.2
MASSRSVGETAHAKSSAHFDRTRLSVGGQKNVPDRRVQVFVSSGVGSSEVRAPRRGLAPYAFGILSLRTIAVPVGPTAVSAFGIPIGAGARGGLALFVRRVSGRVAALAAIARRWRLGAFFFAKLLSNERATLGFV